MATSAYYAWNRDGRPWKVARPIKAIGDRLRGYGYTVYYLGSDDTSHLQAARPLDHCPFSVTGWPVPHPYPYVNAMDVMPPRAGSGLPSLQQLGAQMLADKLGGHPGMAWLKYQNWEPQRDNGGVCYQDSFKPDHARTSSSDRGHIHQSGRSDHVTYTGADTYDPVARVRGARTESATSSPGGTDMARQMLIKADGKLWLVDGMFRRPVPDDWYGNGGGPISDVQTHQASLLGVMGPPYPTGGDLDVWGVDIEAEISRRVGELAAAELARDNAAKAAIDALTAAIAAGGGSVDSAAVIARIDAVAATESQTIAALRADVAALKQKLAAAAQAEATALQQP